jgi:predicted RNase H-like HicB family nuclease
VKKTRQLTGIIEREGSGYVALCPELDIASQGTSIEEARKNLLEALELFYGFAEVRQRGGHIVMQKLIAESTITAPVPSSVSHAFLALSLRLSSESPAPCAAMPYQTITPLIRRLGSTRFETAGIRALDYIASEE